MLSCDTKLLDRVYCKRIIKLMFRHDPRKRDAALRLEWRSWRTSSDYSVRGIDLRSSESGDHWKSYEFKFSDRFSSNPRFKEIEKSSTTTKVDEKDCPTLTDGREELDQIPANILLNLEPADTKADIASVAVHTVTANTTRSISCERLDSYFALNELVHLLEWIAFARSDVEHGVNELTEDFPTLADDFSDFDNLEGTLSNFFCAKQLTNYQSMLDELHSVVAALTSANLTDSSSNNTALDTSSSSPLRVPTALVDIIGHYLPFVPV